MPSASCFSVIAACEFKYCLLLSQSLYSSRYLRGDAEARHDKSAPCGSNICSCAICDAGVAGYLQQMDTAKVCNCA